MSIAHMRNKNNGIPDIDGLRLLSNSFYNARLLTNISLKRVPAIFALPDNRLFHFATTLLNTLRTESALNDSVRTACHVANPH